LWGYPERVGEKSPATDAETLALSMRNVELAHQRCHFGYRRIHVLLRAERCQVNHKRVWRLYSEAKLAVRWRKKIKRPIG
jgi:putative transposase